MNEIRWTPRAKAIGLFLLVFTTYLVGYVIGNGDGYCRALHPSNYLTVCPN